MFITILGGALAWLGGSIAIGLLVGRLFGLGTDADDGERTAARGVAILHDRNVADG